jgi:hypothetical protein
VRACALRLVLLSALIAIPAASSDEEAARGAARRFGQALVAGDAALLREILPARGKVQLRLERFGPEEGYFSPSQVVALFEDFLSHGSVRSLDLLRIEQQPDSRYALVHGRAVLTDRQGRAGQVELHLAFQPEDARWVLREIRETGR